MSYKYFVRAIFICFAGAGFFLSSTAFADSVERELAQMPLQVKELSREMVNRGIPGEDAVQLIQSMHSNRFQEKDIVKTQNMILEVQSKGLPAKPVINKALEGMAKKVTPEKIFQAMEVVTARYSFAFNQARSVASNKEEAGRLGGMLADSLAAGLKEQDASQIISRIKEQSARTNRSGLNELAAACLAMARDMSRLGVSSSLSSQVISNALSKGLHESDIRNMHMSLLSRSRTESAHNISQEFASGMQRGQSENKPGTSGDQSGHGGQGGSGGPGSGGGSGSGGAGGSGGGAGGAGGGGSGGSGGGSGGGGNR